ncbi:MAG: hypothetical protein KA260_05575 [Burkholderiales bacterium]|nr:hypothetical protein [Burkholderiales bacterium]
MKPYLDLGRRFALLTDYTTQSLFESGFDSARQSWAQLLEGRFSVVVGRANFGKTTELKAKSQALRCQGRAALYVALHKVLGDDTLEYALDSEDCEAFTAWKSEGGQLFAFVDSLDEASLGTEDGIRRALRRLRNALDRPNADVKWVLSSRPAVLTEDVLELLQAELRTTVYLGSSTKRLDEDESNTALVSEDENDGGTAVPAASSGDITSAAAVTRTKKVASHDQLKLFALLPLDSAGAALYLQSRGDIVNVKATLSSARQYGLASLTESPGGLDILAHIDPAGHPPDCLSHAFEKVVEAVQRQQRADPRELRSGSPPPESLDDAIGRLACASVLCRLPNIEISPHALQHRDGVLSARPIIASILSQRSLEYLLGSCLFIDSGKYQVKFYPEELLPFLAAKHLASLVKSPEHARRLLANFIWRATTGECGVHRVLLPLAGWLSVFSSHCRKEILAVEPQAVAFFGDLRNPEVQLHEATEALESAFERLVLKGDSLGRMHYRLTAENFWQVGKPGLEPTLLRLFETYSADWHAREALLDIAGHARMPIFRDVVLDAHGRDYSKLLDESLDLAYILVLGYDVDLQALGDALKAKPILPESGAANLLVELAWKALDATSMADIAVFQLRSGKSFFSLDWVLTRDVGPTASDIDLYRLVRSLLLRLVANYAGTTKHQAAYREEAQFVELVMKLLALLLQRPSVAPMRAAKLCLVLHRFCREHHDGGADVVQLHDALRANEAVRMALLVGLISPTLGTADSIAKALFGYPPIYPYVEGDELKLGEPGFNDLVHRWSSHLAISAPQPSKRGNRSRIVSKEAKTTLLSMVEGLRDATAENAMCWVAGWLRRTSSSSRCGECNFELFETAAGTEIAQAVRQGLSALWRNQPPTWLEDEPQSTRVLIIAGLQGLHLDLADGSRLPALRESEVRQAIRYAQFEINGYPKWFWKLVEAHEQVAAQELSEILARASHGSVSAEKAEALIRGLTEAPATVQRILAPAVWCSAVENHKWDCHNTEAALTVTVSRFEVVDQSTFETEAWRRMECAFDEEVSGFREPASPPTSEQREDGLRGWNLASERQARNSDAVAWGSFWLLTYPGSFADRWEAWYAWSPAQAARFMFALAAHLGEDRGGRLRNVSDKGSVGLRALQKLYGWIPLVVKEEDDIKREEGRVYSLGVRDHAQSLRDAIVPAIAHAKSEEAYQVLSELLTGASGPKAKYLRYEQFMMREQQHATKPIAQKNYLEFERTFAPPVSSYIEFAMAIESDLLSVKSQIEIGEFSLRRFFNSLNYDRIKTDNHGLALEEDFQALLGSELNHAAAGRYAVTLEPILPEQTRRDVLCQKGSLRATVELKMSKRWTMSDYLTALEHQLKGQYMMSPNSKIGYFVVVLQEDRQWRGTDGEPVEFQKLLAILSEKARQLEIADSSVYLRVIGIDATPRTDFRAARRLNAGDAAAKYSNGSGKV